LLNVKGTKIIRKSKLSDKNVQTQMLKCFVFICENVTALRDTGGLMFAGLVSGQS
jgi:hypothetical protein